MKNNNRMPKREYFQMRMEQAIANGLERKAEYYRSRLAQMDDKPTPRVEKSKLSNEDKGEIIREKFANMSENEILLECNRVFKEAEKNGVMVNNVIHFLTEVAKVDSTLVMHSMTF